MVAFTTLNPGPTPESLAELERLEDLADAARSAAVDALGTPEFATLNASALQASVNVNNYDHVYGDTTYFEDGNQVSKDDYKTSRLERAIAGSDEPDENIVANVQIGTVTAAEPIVTRQISADELEEEDYEAAVERRNTPGTQEYEDYEEERELEARQAKSRKLFEESAARGHAAADKVVADAAFQQALKDHTDAVTKVNEENDWRVRLHLGPKADYLYAADDPGILAPLSETNGIIFPYTPEIAVQYTADYANYDLAHSNYRGYFYTGSKVENIILTATFTANDIEEANYMLATMHFLRSVTKMFYGQDQKRGMPPPIVFLTGLGEYQFNNHPCALTMFQYNLPTDVDYIPCGKPSGMAQPPIPKREDFTTPESRLRGGECTIGGVYKHDGPNDAAIAQRLVSPYNKATYVPTQISLNFTMIPIQTRDQISKEFSLKEYATGSLLNKGFW